MKKETKGTSRTVSLLRPLAQFEQGKIINTANVTSVTSTTPVTTPSGKYGVWSEAHGRIRCSVVGRFRVQGMHLCGIVASESEVFWLFPSGLPPVPRFPEPLVRCALGASQLAALVGMHVRAMQLTMILITRTRQRGHDGLLQETEALPFLCTLHRHVLVRASKSCLHRI